MAGAVSVVTAPVGPAASSLRAAGFAVYGGRPVVRAPVRLGTAKHVVLDVFHLAAFCVITTAPVTKRGAKLRGKARGKAHGVDQPSARGWLRGHGMMACLHRDECPQLLRVLADHMFNDMLAVHVKHPRMLLGGGKCKTESTPENGVLLSEVVLEGFGVQIVEKPVAIVVGALSVAI